MHLCSLLLAFIAEHDRHMVGNIPFSQFGSAVLAVSPPKLLPLPTLLALGGGSVEETAFML